MMVLFDPKKFEKYPSIRIIDGKVVDERLLKIAKEDTFQEDLTGIMVNMNWLRT